MAKKTKNMPAPKPDECGCEINTKVEMHLGMARQIVGQKELAGDIAVQYLRFCLGRTYTMPTDEDAKDVLESLIRERKAAVQKHIVRLMQTSEAGKKSAESKKEKKQRPLNEKATTVERPLNEKATTVERPLNEKATLLTVNNTTISNPQPTIHKQQLCVCAPSYAKAPAHTLNEIVEIAKGQCAQVIPTNCIENFVKHFVGIMNGRGWADNEGKPIVNIGSLLTSYWQNERNKGSFVSKEKPKMELTIKDYALCMDECANCQETGLCKFGICPPDHKSRIYPSRPETCDHFTAIHSEEVA